MGVGGLDRILDLPDSTALRLLPPALPDSPRLLWNSYKLQFLETELIVKAEKTCGRGALPISLSQPLGFNSYILITTEKSTGKHRWITGDLQARKGQAEALSYSGPCT